MIEGLKTLARRADSKFFSVTERSFGKCLYTVYSLYSSVKDGAKNDTALTMPKLLSDKVQVYGSRACPFIQSMLCLSA